MPKKKNIHPLIIVAVCCIALFCTAVLSLYVICGAGGDLASPPGDEDLQIFVATIEDDKNAYTYLYKVAKKYSSADAVSEFIEDSEYNEKKNPQQIATFLQKTDLWNKNKEILALIDKGLACQQSQVIVEHRDPDFSYGYLSNLSNLCTLIEINSFHLAYNKDIKHAMNLAMKIAQIGQSMQQASLNFTPYMWGTAIKVRAVCALCELLTIAAVDNDFLTF